MIITQFVATADGGSRFEEFDIALDNERVGADAFTLMASKPFDATAVCFVCLPGNLDQDWHQAPARQLVMLLSGSVEVTTTDDKVRRWNAGELFIAGDVSGRGHKTRTIGGPATVIFIPIVGEGLS
ncbi:MAG: hypothetical protein ACI915_004787 [Gammaproteobacteria bacterium]|jgi:hypothetical protein